MYIGGAVLFIVVMCVVWFVWLFRLRKHRLLHLKTFTEKQSEMELHSVSGSGKCCCGAVDATFYTFRASSCRWLYGFGS